MIVGNKTVWMRCIKMLFVSWYDLALMVLLSALTSKLTAVV